MYNEFYSLTEKPFSITPNPKFLYHSKQHAHAITYLEYGIEENAGFILLTGEIGTGKTTLVRYILNEIVDKRDVAVVFNTNVSGGQLLELILQEFNIRPNVDDKAGNLDKLYVYLIRSYAKGNQPLLIIDEGQNLNEEALEEVRMLSNLQTDDKVLLQIMLVGQPELKEKLNNPTLAQLNQRITVNYHLNELSEEDTKEYIGMRMMKAGGDPQIFSDESVSKIFEASMGVPRIINMLCDTALVYGFADELELIGPKIIEQVIKDRAGMGLLAGRNEGPTADKAGMASDGLADSNILKQFSHRFEKLEEDVDFRMSRLEKDIEEIKQLLKNKLS